MAEYVVNELAFVNVRVQKANNTNHLFFSKGLYSTISKFEKLSDPSEIYVTSGFTSYYFDSLYIKFCCISCYFS